MKKFRRFLLVTAVATAIFFFMSKSEIYDSFTLFKGSLIIGFFVRKKQKKMKQKRRLKERLARERRRLKSWLAMGLAAILRIMLTLSLLEVRTIF